MITRIEITPGLTWFEDGMWIAEVVITTTWDDQVDEGKELAMQEFETYDEANKWMETKMAQAMDKIAYIMGIKPYENEFNQL